MFLREKNNFVDDTKLTQLIDVPCFITGCLTLWTCKFKS